MQLQLDFVDVKDIRFGDRTCVIDNVLYINKAEAEKLLTEDPKMASVSVDITYPQEKTRIVNIQDVVEPRCKVTPEGSDFPGYLSKIQAAGTGITRVLRGTAIVLCNPDTNRQFSSFMDMGGQIGKISKFAKMPLVVLTVRKPESITDHWEFDFAIRQASFRLSVYLAKAAAGHPVTETKTYIHDFKNLPRDSKLPRIAYYYQMYTPQYDHQGISEPFFYGTEVRHILPTIIHPNEVLDGGIVCYMPTKSLTTHAIQNHAMITELYDRHGKDLIFCGVIAGAAHMDPVQRERRAMIASGIAKNVMNADGVVLTKIHGGMVHMDLALIAEACEKKGMKSTLFHQGLINAGTLADNALFKSDVLDAVIYMGVTIERFPVKFKPERVLGGTMETVLFSPDHVLMQAKDENIVGEEFLIPGIHDHMGGAAITSYDY